MPRRARTSDTRQLDLFYAFVGDVPLRDEREKEQPGAGEADELLVTYVRSNTPA